MQQTLEKLRVDIRICQYSFNPPSEFGDLFRGCFYLFDAIHNCEDSTLFIDPDIIAIDNISDIEEFCGTKYGIFNLELSKNKKINGLTLKESDEVFSRYSQKFRIPNKIPTTALLGGEILFIPKENINEIRSKLSHFWAWNTENAIKGDAFLTTEEHILTQILKSDNYVFLNRYISRIWTTKKFTKHQGNNANIFQLKLWHLPAEKSRGFIEMYRIMSKNNFEKKYSKDVLSMMAKKKMNIDRPMNLIISYVYSKWTSKVRDWRGIYRRKP
jgi:hypothetical protein